MFKMHQPPELEETDNVSFYEADVSSDASTDASTDASSSESLPFDENSSTGRSSQEPARGRSTPFPGGLCSSPHLTWRGQFPRGHVYRVLSRHPLIFETYYQSVTFTVALAEIHCKDQI